MNYRDIEARRAVCNKLMLISVIAGTLLTLGIFSVGMEKLSGLPEATGKMWGQLGLFLFLFSGICEIGAIRGAQENGERLGPIFAFNAGAIIAAIALITFFVMVADALGIF